MGNKVTCATCVAEYKGKCNAKKGRPSVALNKRRNCDKYELEPTKVRAKQVLKTIRVPYREKEVLRKEYKEQLKQYNAATKTQSNIKHPITGDLSRFASTAGGDRG